MRDLEIIIVLLLILVVFSLAFMPFGFGRHHRFNHHQREDVIFSLQNAIAESVEAGEYRCCIEPACKMCYLGNWIFEDGKCACDDLIAEGKFNQVCPECKGGMEKGQCESAGDSCSVEI